ncbi:Uma2 family endonuclease [Actinophytocola sp.]|uniref:Uma2 family endonuclease n=1 Tax=Actinophytocola sp. TaxID=1872138 RepID=UPI002D7FCAC4|nr:Uma2 family endonuclease [Actinophytocola sp.]HET9139190.1 Uma2 family endonuclease [Actinophytocola sp.]
MSAVTLSDVWPQGDRPLTVDDLHRLPDDGNRYELVDGVLEVSPPPLNNHNLVATRLASMLSMHCPDDLAVLSGNGVNFAQDHLRIPDVIVVRYEWVEPTDFIECPPLLAIEVASKSTRKRDRTVKKREYEAFGIASYWIVEPDHNRPNLTVFELNDTGYDQAALVSGSETFHAERPFPITIVPALLVQSGNAWKAGLA